MSVLGVVLAGGQSTRFGSDKALAEWAGQTLLDHAVATLSHQCDAVIVAGRSEAPAPVIADRPAAGMGPLAGLNGALHHALAHGYDAVLSVPVDGLGLPETLIDELSPAPAHSEDSPVVGLWPAACAPACDALLAEPTVHSLRAFAARIGARSVRLSRNAHNINTPADLAAAKVNAHGL